MDSNKTALVVGGILLAGFVLLPLMNSGNSAQPAAQPGAPTSQQAAPPVYTGPSMTEAELIGSQWRAETPRGALTVALNGGGQFVAAPESAFMATMLQNMTGSSQLVGTWQVSGTTISLSAQAGPQAINISGQIQGQDIVIEGQKAQRLN